MLTALASFVLNVSAASPVTTQTLVINPSAGLALVSFEAVDQFTIRRCHVPVRAAMLITFEDEVSRVRCEPAVAILPNTEEAVGRFTSELIEQLEIFAMKREGDASLRRYFGSIGLATLIGALVPQVVGLTPLYRRMLNETFISLGQKGALGMASVGTLAATVNLLRAERDASIARRLNTAWPARGGRGFFVVGPTRTFNLVYWMTQEALFRAGAAAAPPRR